VIERQLELAKQIETKLTELDGLYKEYAELKARIKKDGGLHDKEAIDIINECSTRMYILMMLSEMSTRPFEAPEEHLTMHSLTRRFLDVLEPGLMNVERRIRCLALLGEWPNYIYANQDELKKTMKNKL